MEQYTVTGMSCAACAARVEKAVSGVEGVTSCSVSLLTNAMGVEGSASADAVIAAVEKAGYGAALRNAPGPAGGAAHETKSGASARAGVSRYAAEEEALADHETPKLKRRLFLSLGFLLVLMYVSMGHAMLHLPLPAFFEGNPLAIALLELLLSSVILIINRAFFESGLRSLLHGAPNMDTLVAMGSGISWIYSLVILFLMTRDPAQDAMTRLHSLYFESAAMILTLITVGKMLEARSKGKTTDALKSLLRLSPKTARVLRGGTEAEIPVEDVRVGDLFVVRPGENIPVDGVVVSGDGAVNEAALTGESIPVDKAAGDSVSAATSNQAGFLTCRATRVGEDTTLSQIIRMVSDAAATKAPIAKIADKVAGVFVPAVICVAAVVFAIWLLTGAEFSFALSRAIAVLVISCPCALGLATPVAIMVGSGVGARNGILFKTSAALEETGRIRTVVLDKTGTVTKGEPTVRETIPHGVTEEELLYYAAGLEAKSEHPLAKAVLAEAKRRGTGLPDSESFSALPGNGLRATIDGAEVMGGKASFIAQHCEIPGALSQKAEELAGRGITPLYFAKDGKCIGLIGSADVLKEDSRKAVGELHDLGIRVVMLTGDNQKTAAAVAKDAGITEVIADVLPDGKESVIRSLSESGKVAMIGDGINDAPALTRADIGIAIGAGADVAVDAADVVLAKSSLLDAAAAIRLSRGTLRNIHENLFWAFFYNVLCIPLAAGAFEKSFGISLNPMIGAAAMSLSSFFVVTNALRLNLLKIYKTENKTVRAAEKGKKEMKKTMKIEGMMCMHCEARVKKALLAVPGVADAEVSHEAGTAVVTLAEDVSDDVLRQAVEAQDYPVISIE